MFSDKLYVFELISLVNGSESFTSHFARTITPLVFVKHFSRTFWLYQSYFSYLYIVSFDTHNFSVYQRNNRSFIIFIPELKPIFGWLWVSISSQYIIKSSIKFSGFFEILSRDQPNYLFKCPFIYFRYPYFISSPGI